MSALLDTAAIASLLGVNREYVTDKLTKRPDFPRPTLDLSRRMRKWNSEHIAAWVSNGATSDATALFGALPDTPPEAVPRAPTVEDFLVASFRNARRRSKRSGRHFAITQEGALDMLQKQRKCCAVSGVPFSLDAFAGHKWPPFAPSVDRIDSSDGYTEKNVRIVCCCVNFLMNAWGDSVYRQLLERAKRVPSA